MESNETEAEKVKEKEKEMDVKQPSKPQWPNQQQVFCLLPNCTAILKKRKNE